jgi:transglutaminase superfamily protein
MLRKLRRLRELSTGELLVLLQLVLFALLARMALMFVALPQIAQLLSWGANHRLLACLPAFHGRYEPHRLARLADLAARATRADGPCLLRSILLLWLLKARGEQPELLIGINKDNGKLNSHAWIEIKGIVMGDSMAMIRRFDPFLRF